MVAQTKHVQAHVAKQNHSKHMPGIRKQVVNIQGKCEITVVAAIVCRLKIDRLDVQVLLFTKHFERLVVLSKTFNGWQKLRQARRSEAQRFNKSTITSFTANCNNKNTN